MENQRKSSYINGSKFKTMKHKLLLTLIIAGVAVSAHAQKRSQRTTAYAITSEEKGVSKWNGVRLVDVNTGEEIQSVYQSSMDIPVLNARTGKAIVKKQQELPQTEAKTIVMIDKGDGYKTPVKRVIYKTSCGKVSGDKPFATNSAACAYDKKHERLYYTPMGINQLRYIDLNAKNPSVYYFEDEPFGVLSGPGDVQNQITRMVMGSDGNGYALTNNAEHLIRFTTKKKAVITDLGAITDDASNGKYSVHSQSGYGGDMVADNKDNLYLITANLRVFKINIETRVATYKGMITGLPRGFTTNGAAVESGTNIIVSSATSISGYYKFDLNDLQAQKVSTGESVYNASDLANANLVSEKKKKKDKEEEQPAEVQQPQTVETATVSKVAPVESLSSSKLTVYPNPVTNGIMRLSFADYPAGRYEVRLMDVTGKLFSSQEVSISNKIQVEQVQLPLQIAKGNYIVKVLGENGNILTTEKIIVQ